MAAKPVADWSVDDVVAMLYQLSLGHVAEPFRWGALQLRESAHKRGRVTLLACRHPQTAHHSCGTVVSMQRNHGGYRHRGVAMA